MITEIFCFGLCGLTLVGGCLKHLLELGFFSVSDTTFQFQINNCMTECSVELIQFDQALSFFLSFAAPYLKHGVLLALISHAVDHSLINSSISVNNGFSYKELDQ